MSSSAVVPVNIDNIKLTCMSSYLEVPGRRRLGLHPCAVCTEAGIKKSLTETRRGRDGPSAHNMSGGNWTLSNRPSTTYVRAMASWMLPNEDVIWTLRLAYRLEY